MEETTPVVEETTTVESETTQNTTETTVDPRVAELEEKNKQLYERTKKGEAEAKALKAQLDAAKSASTKSLDVEDYIDISASLEGLDQREKEKLAREHKLTGRPLTEIRKDEDFQLWQNAYRAKAEKERLTLKPSGTQSESERPRSLNEKLVGASVAEKEKLLVEAGYYKSPRGPRTDAVSIGGSR
jgi:hypothetical protein